MTIVKRIFIYLKGVEAYGLWYKQYDNFSLEVYTNVDWAGNVDDGNNTSGEAFFLGERLVAWIRKKENFISQSTIEAEYVVIAINCSSIV